MFPHDEVRVCVCVCVFQKGNGLTSHYTMFEEGGGVKFCVYFMISGSILHIQKSVSFRITDVMI
jgi:hypothetical protein